MDQFDVDVSHRDVGSFNLSIATSLAFDSLLGVNLPENQKENPPIKVADSLWINFRTLFRNLIGSLSDSAKDFITEEQAAEALFIELKTIVAAVENTTAGSVKVVFYFCTYKSLPRLFPHAMHRELKTNNQRWAYQLEEHTYKKLKPMLDDSIDFREYDTDINAIVGVDVDVSVSFENIYLLSHAPVDLLSRYNFNSIRLIESHTGAIKLHYQWHTKLLGLNGVETIPFNRMTLQIFGDNAYFRPMPIKLRRFLITVSEKEKWTPTTTKDKILADIEDQHDPVLEAFISKLF